MLHFFLHHTLILRPALLYSQFTAMLVKSGSSNQTVDLVPMGACVNCTTTYSQLNALNVIKFIPSTSHLINTSLPPFVGNNENDNDDTRSNGHIRFLKTDVTKIVSIVNIYVIVNLVLGLETLLKIDVAKLLD